MPYLLPQDQQDKFSPYVFFKDSFTPEECEVIIHDKFLRNAPLQKAVTGNGDDPRRVSNVAWIDWTNHSNWVFEKLSNIVFNANKEWFQYHLSAFGEPLQLTQYKSETKGHYDWHQDWGGKEFSCRKLSTVTLLSDPINFKGGEFEIFNIGPIADLKRGTTIVFPSFQVHRVNPVSEGTRWSLVSWVTGPKYV